MSLVETGKAFLEHYGVKGQRWGVRRTQATLDKAAGRKSDSGGESNSGGGKGSDSGKNSRNPGKSKETLTDKELKDYVNRMNMEQQYVKYQPTSASQKAVKFLGEIALNVARTQIQNQANDYVGTLIKAKKQGRSLRGIPAPPSVPSFFPPPFSPPNPNKRKG